MSVCPIYDPEDRCYIARPNGNFERGCMSSSTTRCRSDDDVACHICMGPGCNFIDFNSAIDVRAGAKIIAIALFSIALTMINY